MQSEAKRLSGWVWIGLIAVLLAVAGAGYVKFGREVAQPQWISGGPAAAMTADRFNYGSLNAEHSAYLPYWVVYVLPSMFPEKLLKLHPSGDSQTGGLAVLRLSWEEGVELPIGLAKKTVGYPRITLTCAACHTRSVSPGGAAAFTASISGATDPVDALSRFIYQCALDPRFNPDNILAEMANMTRLSWLDQLAYRFIIIPRTRAYILKGGEHFLWAYGGQGLAPGGAAFGHHFADALPDVQRQSLVAYVRSHQP